MLVNIPYMEHMGMDVEYPPSMLNWNHGLFAYGGPPLKSSPTHVFSYEARTRMRSFFFTIVDYINPWMNILYHLIL